MGSTGEGYCVKDTQQENYLRIWREEGRGKEGRAERVMRTAWWAELVRRILKVPCWKTVCLPVFAVLYVGNHGKLGLYDLWHGAPIRVMPCFCFLNQRLNVNARLHVCLKWDALFVCVVVGALLGAMINNYFRAGDGWFGMANLIAVDMAVRH